MKYRVCWRSKLTGATGKGTYAEELLAEAWLAEARAKWPSFDHWLEDEQGEAANKQATKEQEEV